MSQCALFAHNVLNPHPRGLNGAGAGGTSVVLGASPSSTRTPVDNVRDPRPRVVFSHPAGNGGFQVLAANQWIDFKYIPAAGGGGTATLKIPAGFYNTGAALAAEIESQINLGASGAGMHVNTHFDVRHDTILGYFTIEMIATASDQFQILWKTGSHGSDGAGNNLGGVLGYWLAKTSAADSANIGLAAPAYRALAPRYGGATFVRGRNFATGPDQVPYSPSPDLYSCHLFAQGDWDRLVGISGYRPDFGGWVKVYVSSTDFGDFEQAWIDGVTAGTASVFSFSGRDNVDHFSSETDNALQVAFSTASTAPSARYWYFSWIHADAMKTHEVGTLGMWIKSGSGTHKQGSSPTRTVTQLRGLQILDDSTTMTSSNAYPASGLQRWEVPIKFDDWTLAEWHDVFEETVRTARQSPCIFALNWTAIVDGKVTATVEAHAGFLVYATISKVRGGDFSGYGSEYVSGSLTLEQMR